MVDLSHWDFAQYFDGYDTAALILGFEPRDSAKWKGKITVVEQRLELHFRRALERAHNEIFKLDDEPDQLNIFTGELPSAALEFAWRVRVLKNNNTQINALLGIGSKVRFDFQSFSRDTIAKWLDANGLVSSYDFGKDGNNLIDLRQDQSEVEPSNLPLELDAANVVFRAFTIQYRDSTLTPKKWLIEYLKKHYGDFKAGQIQRIATVANPDKTTGRKKNGKE